MKRMTKKNKNRIKYSRKTASSFFSTATFSYGGSLLSSDGNLGIVVDLVGWSILPLVVAGKDRCLGGARLSSLVSRSKLHLDSITRSGFSGGLSGGSRKSVCLVSDKGRCLSCLLSITLVSCLLSCCICLSGVGMWRSCRFSTRSGRSCVICTCRSCVILSGMFLSGTCLFSGIWCLDSWGLCSGMCCLFSWGFSCLFGGGSGLSCLSGLYLLSGICRGSGFGSVGVGVWGRSGGGAGRGRLLDWGVHARRGFSKALGSGGTWKRNKIEVSEHYFMAYFRCNDLSM